MATYEKSKVIDLENSIDYASGGVVSKQVTKNKAGNITLFSFDKDQGLTEDRGIFADCTKCCACCTRYGDTTADTGHADGKCGCNITKTGCCAACCNCCSFSSLCCKCVAGEHHNAGKKHQSKEHYAV